MTAKVPANFFSLTQSKHFVNDCSDISVLTSSLKISGLVTSFGATKFPYIWSISRGLDR